MQNRMGFSPAHPRLWSRFPAIAPVTLKDNGLVYIELRPDLDFETIRGNLGIPTIVTRGVFRGLSLPIYAANDEQLHGTMCVPNRYDEASDVIIHLYCWLAQAEDDKNFNMRVSWEHYTPGTDAVPNTSINVDVETPTGVGAIQFQSYIVEFTLTYGDLVADDIMGLRVRRIAAEGDECVDEIVVNHYGILFRRDKLGVAA